MTDKLQEIKEALEKALCFNKYDENSTGDEIYKALTTLNSYIEARDSEGWQPIETAPKDGTIMLTWGDVPRNIRVANFNPHVNEWDYYPYGSSGFKVEEPSHWMPLPQPPKVMEGGE